MDHHTSSRRRHRLCFLKLCRVSCSRRGWCGPPGRHLRVCMLAPVPCDPRRSPVHSPTNLSVHALAADGLGDVAVCPACSFVKCLRLSLLWSSLCNGGGAMECRRKSYHRWRLVRTMAVPVGTATMPFRRVGELGPSDRQSVVASSLIPLPPWGRRLAQSSIFISSTICDVGLVGSLSSFLFSDSVGLDAVSVHCCEACLRGFVSRFVGVFTLISFTVRKQSLILRSCSFAVCCSNPKFSIGRIGVAIE
ncbi:hypothetical protein BS78_05G239700 [Paspalum vaginatum]|nr:hypothetical protein BS78_05G239700 [Paspalum vaginatum]